ncbi:MAG: glycosyltransferase family 39 protein [Acidobacteriota bacterium]|nr:glycosyltransferase family 39 protein [Acidobacteriota bacterium]
MVRALFGGFAALQTFFFLARRDRFAVLFWWTGETWLYVLLLWLKDLALAAAAGFLAARLLALVTEAAAREEREPPAPFRLIVEAACVVPALAFGIVLRWIFLEWNPPGLWVDVVYAARPLFGGASVSPWGATYFGELATGRELVSNLYVAFVRGVFAVFGSGETGFFAVSALPGSLAVPAFWWLAREAFGPRTAVLAVWCGALLGWPLLLSRWSSTAALLVVLVLVAAAAALFALRTGRLAFAALSGACVGLSLHTHASAGAVAAGFAAFALLVAREVKMRRLVLVAAAAAALAFAPLAWGFLSEPDRIGGHLRDVHVGTPVKDADTPRAAGALGFPVALASNALEYTGVLLWTRDPNLRHAAGLGIVTPPVGIAMLLGFGLAASRRRPADVLLLLLAAGSLLAGILSNPGGAPNSLRVSALVVPATIFLSAVLETGIGRAVRGGALSRGVLLSGVVVAVFASETLPALVEFPARQGVGANFCMAETEAGRILARLSEAPVVIVKGAVRHPAVVEAVAHGANLAVPLGLYARKTVAELSAQPPEHPFWVLASPRGLAELSAGGLVCGRGIALAGDGSGLLLARVRPRG